MSIAIIIPVYNCAGKISQSIYLLNKFCLKHFQEYEIIVVNDNSSDKTLNILNSLVYKNLKIVNLTRNKGKGGAIKEGIRKSQGNFILFTDADLPYDLSAFTNMVSKLERDCDLVLGSRRHSKSTSDGSLTFGRSIMSILFSKLANFLLIENIADTQCGMKGFSRHAALDVFDKLEISGFCFDVEIIYRAQLKNYKICLVPTHLMGSDKSSINFFHALQMFIDLTKLFIRFKL